MAFLLKHAVFIHIPKTGGQWVAQTLEDLGLVEGRLGVVHASPDEIESIAGYRERTFRFAFVRHPMTWYQSIWAHRMDEEWEAIDDPGWFSERWIGEWAALTDDCRSDDFATFVRNCLERFPSGFVSTLFGHYTRDCTFVGRQERLADDLCKALDLAGETFDRKRLLASRPRNVRGRQPKRRRQAMYTSDLAIAVARTERQAIQRWAYSDFPPDPATAPLEQA